MMKQSRSNSINNKRVSFGYEVDIPMTAAPVMLTYEYQQSKWYTESELTLIEITNRTMAKNYGVSRGLELVYDELFGQQLEAFQRYHTRSVLGEQRAQQQETGYVDDLDLQLFSRYISERSSMDAQYRATPRLSGSGGYSQNWLGFRELLDWC
ncbi:expressed unknown protein [Seminavis robusta]|uniref:Uncharacterized protein n=1 Tax=Seminavis robusta TaxID=568900 RepID=A0A9N8DZ33_9STRA|nr:expressed unknown protein [Seminavis robusta]|eukprot:Sro356_g125210.1 n/a (153) ;mRNA; r:4380-4838